MSGGTQDRALSAVYLSKLTRLIVQFLFQYYQLQEYQKAKATNNKSWVYWDLLEVYFGEGGLSLNPLVGCKLFYYVLTYNIFYCLLIEIVIRAYCDSLLGK